MAAGFNLRRQNLYCYPDFAQILIAEAQSKIKNTQNKIKNYCDAVDSNLKENAFTILKNNPKIKEVIINFKNGYSQPFMFYSNKNTYSETNNNDLCLIQSEYNIKYKENLFA